MESHFSRQDSDKLLELQEKCEICKEMIVREEVAGSKLELRRVCEKCKKVRMRLPELIEVKRKLMDLDKKE